jgi:hypothetical protein
MPNDPASVSNSVLAIDDIASEALSLGLSCGALGVEATSAAKAGDIQIRLHPAACIARSGLPLKHSQQNPH